MPDLPPIYVGYLDLPRRHRRFVVGAGVALVCSLAAAAGVIALSQRDPGDAVWEVGVERRWTGVVRMEPYPMLVEADGTARFIVGMGKFAVRERVAPFDGMLCEVRGTSLAREHRRIIELSMGDHAIVQTGTSSPLPQPTHRQFHPRDVTVVGEIVDGKCYLGSMKPGNGKTHKACAILCIEGGLPPLVAADVPGAGRLYPLLRVDGSTVLPQEVLGVVGEPVRITGRLSELHGLPILDVPASDIQRLGTAPQTRPAVPDQTPGG